MLAALSVFKLRVKKCPLVAATYDRSLFPVFRNDRNGLNYQRSSVANHSILSTQNDISQGSVPTH